MTHGAIDRLAKGRTAQRGSWVACARAQRRGGLCVAVTSIRPVAPPGLPLPARGASVAGPAASGGAVAGGHVQRIFPQQNQRDPLPPLV